MNLFLIGWNLTATERQRALQVLTAMHETFPLLDPATIGSWNSQHGFACWMHHAPNTLAPRQYLHQTDDTLTLYDGVTVDPTNRFAAHDARQLANHWDTLTDTLEGHFATARLDGPQATLEIINDPSGAHPTYTHHRGHRWWIANRVRLLAGAAGLTTLDPQGAATFLGMHWPGADHTLVEGITKMPAAQRWRWQGDAAPQTTTYWPAADLAHLRRHRFGPQEAAALATEMHAPLRILTDAFGPLDCPITAGHDTRMLTGLVMTTGRPAEYVTFGAPDDTDMIAATAIANKLGLPHKRYEAATHRSPQAWDDTNRRLIQQNDGMLSLMHARSRLDPPLALDRIPVALYGGGGELARGKQLSPSFVVRPTLPAAIAILQRAHDRGGVIRRAETRQVVRDHIESTCRSLLDLGFDAVDIPDAFKMVEQYRRWGALQAFQRADEADMFVPFFQRTYIRNAFATPPAQRLLQRVPHHLIHHLSPTLRAMPSGSPWPPNSLAAYATVLATNRLTNRLRREQRRFRPTTRTTPARKRERTAILLAQLPRWRERHLDRPDADAWRVLDPDRYEHLTSSHATDAEKTTHLEGLYLATTVLAFEEDLEAWTQRWE